jgi:hypothetical protein
MATSKKQVEPKAAKKKKREAPAPRKPSKRSPSGPSPNFLINASNGLFVQSGTTGEVRKLTDEEAAAVSKLLEKRQKLGLEIAELLQTRGFDLPTSIIWDGPPW